MVDQLKENPKFLRKEKAIQENIHKCIDDFENFIFEAGAGSGKTYALKESVQYVLENYGEKLDVQNQKILCITFTNTAKDEIKKDNYYSELLNVHTIHDFLWKTISPHQNLLFNEHARKIKDEIDTYKKLESHKKFLNKIDDANICIDYFNKIISDDKIKKTHHQCYNAAAKTYREEMKKCIAIQNVDKILRNVGEFKKYLQDFYRYEKMENTKKDMLQKKFQKISYDHLISEDRLHQYRISHDTVLEYAKEIIIRYDVMKKKIIDQYPYIFVDEYQDTSEDVIQILKNVSNYARETNQEFVIGLFGDSVQNIYEKGIGDQIIENSTFKIIKKPYNRRSSRKIIDLANRIRNDGLKQESIYEDADFGKVKLIPYIEDNFDDLKPIVESHFNTFKKEKHFRENIQDMCMMARHKDVASLQGFGGFFDTVSSLKKYSGSNYNRLNSSFLANQNEDLDPFFRVLAETLGLYGKIEGDVLLSELLSYNKKLVNMTYLELSQLIRMLLSLKEKMPSMTLECFMKEMFDKTKSYEHFQFILESFIPSKTLTYDSFKQFSYEELLYTQSMTDEEIDRENDKISRVLETSMQEIIAWNQYRAGNYDDLDINYSTMHNTKGAEFNNVVIVLNDQFAGEKDYFSRFFKEYPNIQETKEARNLLYVACTRACVNLIVMVPKEMYTENKATFVRLFEDMD